MSEHKEYRQFSLTEARERLQHLSVNTIFFDLDGTLINSKKGIGESLQYAIAELGGKIPEIDDITIHVGQPLRGVFADLLPGADASLIEKAVKIYRSRFETHGFSDADLFPGILELLAQLTANGRQLYIVTAKVESAAVQVADHFGIRRFMKRIFGPTPEGLFSIKKDLLQHALAETKANRSQAVMIGDTRADVSAAKGNGVFAVGVSYGFGSRESLAQHGAHVICDSVDELKAIF
jgi:phosphoglycolate phosphatase